MNYQKGDGQSASGTSRLDTTTRQLGDHARRIRNEAQSLSTAIQDAAGDLERSLKDQCEHRPYMSLAAAAGIGYVLGGGLSSRLTVLMFNMTTKLVMAFLARELAATAETPR